MENVVETIDIGPKTEEELISLMWHVAEGCLTRPLSIRVVTHANEKGLCYNIEMFSNGVLVDTSPNHGVVEAVNYMSGICMAAACYRRQFSLKPRKRYRDY
jgi:hypothetical protein